MANFNLTETALKMFYPGNEALKDDAGLPSVMVYIPKFTNDEVLENGDTSVHPAFIVNGKEIDGFWYSKYQNVIHNGRGYSLPAEDPAVNINFETARECCENKGHGWHLATAAEWAAIALLCNRGIHTPSGNNNYGKDVTEETYKAIPTTVDADGRTGRVATGTGPLSWSHDGTMAGIWDLNGNVWEWQAGFRMVHGEIQILANNDAADPDNPQNNTSLSWRAINASDGSLVDPECNVGDTAPATSGATVRLDYVNSVWTYSTEITSASANGRSCLFTKVTCTDAISDAAKKLLMALALFPGDISTTIDDTFNLTNGGAESFVHRGGRWGTGAAAGMLYLIGNILRTDKSPGTGFRASYIPGIE